MTEKNVLTPGKKLNVDSAGVAATTMTADAVAEEAEERDRGHRALRAPLSKVFYVAAVVYAAFQMFVIYYPLSTLQLRAVHVGFALALIFGLVPPTKKAGSQRTVPWYDWILIALSIAVCAYITVESAALSRDRLGFYNNLDVAASIALVLLVLEATRRVLGWVLPAIAICFLAYSYLGSYAIGPLQTRSFSVERIATHMALWTEGIFGTAIGASAGFIMLFVIFATFLQRSGAGQFFIDIALYFFGRFRGGPAKVAVIGSSLFGSVSGSAVANVAGTGTLTIPMMKRSGFKKEDAAAVEAVSSSGGQLVPPIMGAGAFVMADMLGIPYMEIAIAAIIPAVLYYVAVFISVDVTAVKDNARGLKSSEIPPIGETLRKGWHLPLPLIVLVGMMTVGGFSPGRAVFWAIPACVVVSWISPDTRMGIRDIIDAFVTGTKGALEVVIVCACAGIIIGVFSLTGLGLTLSSSLVAIAGQSIMLLLVLTMVACVIAGMGVPTVAAYIVVAVLVAPALTEFGISPLQAHLFVFYIAIMSAITPPVALASYVAAGIAGAKPWPASIRAVQMALGGMIVPFLFVMDDHLLGVGNPLTVLLAVLSAIIGITFVSFGALGYDYVVGHLNPILRIVAIVIGFGSMIPSQYTNILGVLIGLVYAAIFYLTRNRRKEAKVSDPQLV